MVEKEHFPHSPPKCYPFQSAVPSHFGAHPSYLGRLVAVPPGEMMSVVWRSPLRACLVQKRGKVPDEMRNCEERDNDNDNEKDKDNIKDKIMSVVWRSSLRAGLLQKRGKVPVEMRNCEDKNNDKEKDNIKDKNNVTGMVYSASKERERQF